MSYTDETVYMLRDVTYEYSRTSISLRGLKEENELLIKALRMMYGRAEEGNGEATLQEIFSYSGCTGEYVEIADEKKEAPVKEILKMRWDVCASSADGTVCEEREYTVFASEPVKNVQNVAARFWERTLMCHIYAENNVVLKEALLACYAKTHKTEAINEMAQDILIAQVLKEVDI